MRAMDVLELEGDPDFEEIKSPTVGSPRPFTRRHSWRQGRRRPVQAVQAAYEVLRKAEERRSALSS
jgi:hypothetical protein